MDSIGGWDKSKIQSVVVTAEKLTDIIGGAFLDCTKLTTVELLNVTQIGGCAFTGCTALESFNLSNVTTIDMEVFKGCTGLKTINLSNVTDIGLSAFEGCTALGSVDLSKVTTIGMSAFEGCTNLTLTGNLDNITNMDNNPFGGCTEIKAFPSIADTNTAFKNIDGVLFKKWYSNQFILIAYPVGNKSTEYSCSAEVNGINPYAFKGCTSLETVTISKVEKIYLEAFKGCTSLKKVSIRNCKYIKDSAFEGCTALEKVKVPSCKKIEIRAFEGCTKLKTVIAPICKEIQHSAFKGCTLLQAAVIKNRCTIGTDAFKEVPPPPTFKLYVLTDGEEISVTGAESLNLIEATKYSIDSDIYIATGGMIFDESDNLLKWGGDCGAPSTSALLWTLDDEGTLKIKGDGTEMKDYTTDDSAPWYTHKDKIKNVEIEASELKNIGDYAFNGCTSLNTVIMPKVSKIGGNAFNDCKSLNTVVIPNSCAIETGAFNGVPSTSKLYVLTDTNKEQINVTGADSLTKIKATKDSEGHDIYITTDGMIFNIWENSFAFIDISPKLANIEKGTTQQFTAKIISTSNLEPTVTWAVTGGKLIGTSIDAGGKLSVSIGETAKTLTITATSTEENRMFGTATVTVTEPSTGGGYFPPTPTPDPTAPIQPKEHTITNADGTKTTVILFDGTKSGTPAKGEALLSAEALAKIAAVKGAGAVVATSTSIVQFDQKALQAITGGQTKGNIKVIAEIVNPNTLTPEQKALLGDNALIIDLSVENENGKVTDFNGGTATVVIKIPAGVDPTTLGAVYIKTNGKLEKVEGKVVMVNGVATFQFVTNHFSKFAVLDKATIAKAIAAQDAMAKDKLVKGVKATKLTAIKAVAKKSNVTVTWKKSKGYKVDGYQIWKSSKKTTDYKMMAKRTGQKYKNTYGLKAGKTYYYKVRGFREIDGKIVYTKWAQAKVVAK